MTTQEKGEIAQLKVEQRAIEKGLIVSRPRYDARYDAILDDGNKLLRVQIKYADGKSGHSQGAVIVPLRKMHKNHVLLYTAREVDLILAYIPSVDKIVRIEPSMFENRPAVVIRLTPPKNGQAERVNLIDNLLW